MAEKTGVIIGRPINGISINGFEYALDENNEYLHFDSKDDAKNFLREKGAPEEDIEEFYEFRYHAFCLNCGKEYFLHEDETFIDDLGRGYLCPECGSTFDVI